jgi:hypothetical protein
MRVSFIGSHVLVDTTKVSKVSNVTVIDWDRFTLASRGDKGMRIMRVCFFAGLALSGSLLLASPARAAGITIINNTNFGGLVVS